MPDGAKNAIRNKNAIYFLSSVMFSFLNDTITLASYKYPLKYNLYF
tara:strand:+ start:8870 stop:9007 length:138 start_codon:yes stop_codon:yes gene_type:complete